MKKNYLALAATAILCFGFYSCEKQPVDLSENNLNNSLVELSTGSKKLQGEEVDKRMEKLAKKLAKKLENKDLRKIIKSEVGKRFDGDYDVLLSDLFDKSLNGQKIKSLVEEGENLTFDDLGDVSKFINVSIPVNFERWNENNYEPLVAVKSVFYDSKDSKEITAYDAKGKITKLDAQKAPTVPVIVIGLNERVELKPNKTLSLKNGIGNEINNQLKTHYDEGGDGGVSTELLPGGGNGGSGDGGGGGGGGVGTNSGPGTGKYHVDQCYEYLTEINCTDINQYEGWIAGAPELRLIVHYKDFNENKIADAAAVNILMEPNDRSDINNNWWSLPNDQQLWVWDYQRSGLTQLYSWYEEDESISFSPDKLIPLATNFKTLVTLPGGIYTVAFLALTTSLSIKGSTEFIGQVAVDSRPNIFEYGVGTGLRFRSKTTSCVENDQPIFNLVQ